MMNNKLYYWAENLEDYSADNEEGYGQVIEIKRLNFFIGKNNAGKSRFLRNLFMNDYPSNFYNNLTVVKNVKSLKDNIYKIDSIPYSATNANLQHYTKELLLNLNDKKTDQLIFLNSSINQIFNNNYKILELFPQYQQLEHADNYIDQLDTLFSNKYYLPILRGMRPVTETENKQPYIERAQKDYFKDTQKFNSENIITGESLYHELKIHLLGEPEQRELIKKYEEKLSQYFFDNEPVSLIPKHDQDVVNIKIGKDRQFPISQLGDGLQQAIILTFEAFTQNKDVYAFFIEEPELHMHAGMVRQLMNFYLNETEHYYFFTTHSNHLLDMADESDQVIIQKFVKDQNKDDLNKFDFKIYRCDRDRDLLASLGVKPSSVYLANCTIWVEGITDRLYITKYMDKYLSELKNPMKSYIRNTAALCQIITIPLWNTQEVISYIGTLVMNLQNILMIKV
jgi:predicted ATP-dependent endonuclease of OLD family